MSKLAEARARIEAAAERRPPRDYIRQIVLSIGSLGQAADGTRAAVTSATPDAAAARWVSSSEAAE